MFRCFGETYCYRRFFSPHHFSGHLNQFSSPKDESSTFLRHLTPKIWTIWSLYDVQTPKMTIVWQNQLWKIENIYVGCFSITVHAVPSTCGKWTTSGFFFPPSDFPDSHFDVFVWRQPRNNFRSEMSMFVWGISRASIRRINKESDQSTASLTRDTMTRDHLPCPQRGSEFTGSWLGNSGTDCAPRSQGTRTTRVFS